MLSMISIPNTEYLHLHLDADNSTISKVPSIWTRFRVVIEFLRGVDEGDNLLAFASTEIASIQAAFPCGSSNNSMPVICSIGRGIQSTKSVKDPIRLPIVIAKIMPRPGLVPSGGQASFL